MFFFLPVFLSSLFLVLVIADLSRWSLLAMGRLVNLVCCSFGPFFSDSLGMLIAYTTNSFPSEYVCVSLTRVLIVRSRQYSITTLQTLRSMVSYTALDFGMLRELFVSS